MNQQITAKQFREHFRDEAETVSKIVDKHYEKLWDIAEALQAVCSEPIRIKTVFGDFTFMPAMKDYSINVNC